MGDRGIWVGYTVYFYDEDNGKNYFKQFLSEVEPYENLYHSVLRFLYLIELVDNGKGIETEIIKTTEFKKLKGYEALWEYRIKDGKSKKLVRIYFGVLEELKKIVILNAHFKSNDKDQEREIKVAEERYKRYKTQLTQDTLQRRRRV